MDLTTGLRSLLGGRSSQVATQLASNAVGADEVAETVARETATSFHPTQLAAADPAADLATAIKTQRPRYEPRAATSEPLSSLTSAAQRSTGHAAPTLDEISTAMYGDAPLDAMFEQQADVVTAARQALARGATVPTALRDVHQFMDVANRDTAFREIALAGTQLHLDMAEVARLARSGATPQKLDQALAQLEYGYRGAALGSLSGSSGRGGRTITADTVDNLRSIATDGSREERVKLLQQQRDQTLAVASQLRDGHSFQTTSAMNDLRAVMRDAQTSSAVGGSADAPRLPVSGLSDALHTSERASIAAATAFQTGSGLANRQAFHDSLQQVASVYDDAASQLAALPPEV